MFKVKIVKRIATIVLRPIFPMNGVDFYLIIASTRLRRKSQRVIFLHKTVLRLMSLRTSTSLVPSSSWPATDEISAGNVEEKDMIRIPTSDIS